MIALLLKTSRGSPLPQDTVLAVSLEAVQPVRLPLNPLLPVYWFPSLCPRSVLPFSLCLERAVRSCHGALVLLTPLPGKLWAAALRLHHFLGPSLSHTCSQSLSCSLAYFIRYFLDGSYYARKLLYLVSLPFYLLIAVCPPMHLYPPSGFEGHKPQLYVSCLASPASRF